MLKSRDLDSMTRMLERFEKGDMVPDPDAGDDAFVRTMIGLTARAIATMEQYLPVATDTAVLAWAQEELDDTREDADELNTLLADLEEDDADPNDTSEPYAPD